jgi:hypothetical protein
MSEQSDELSSDLKKLYRRAKRYGLNPFQLESLLSLRPGCWICGRIPKAGQRRYVDHDHTTERVRGVLCFTCNYRLLGKGALNRPELHEMAAIYLRSPWDARKDL